MKTFDTVEEVLEAEILLHNFYQVDKNPHFANKVKMITEKFYNYEKNECKIYDPKFQNEFIGIVKNSKTIIEIIKKLGKKRGGSNYDNVNKWITLLELDDSHLIGVHINKGKIRTKEVREKMSSFRKGQTKTKEHKKKIKLSNCKYVYTFISPNGIVTETVWYADFCKENDLNRCKIREVTRGIRLHHKGWKATRRPITNDDK